MSNAEIPRGHNKPLYSLATAVLLTTIGALVLIFGSENGSNTVVLIGLVATTVPSLIAAAFSERTARDVRNGVLEEKARRGAHTALEESGVKEVVDMTHRGETSLLAMEALSRLLERNINNNDSVTGEESK